MMVRARIESLKEGRWYEHIVRFALGGAATVMTGLVAQFGGPEVGGLFLAFPAMLCASATLVDAHERRHKREKGLRGTSRGRDAAALDAAGAALGAMALLAFAFTVYAFASRGTGVALWLASASWCMSAAFCWALYKRRSTLVQDGARRCSDGNLMDKGWGRNVADGTMLSRRSKRSNDGTSRKDRDGGRA